MFLANSRYYKVATVETQTTTGETVVALRLRQLVLSSGELRMVVAGDRLDLLAHSILADATRFWQIADTNTALDGRTLVEAPGDTLITPRS